MNRPIKFRGIKVITADKFTIWTYGNLIICKNGDYVINKREHSKQFGNHCPTASKVDPDTVGQYTGLKDCNSTEIYEGDILRYWFGDDNYDTGFIAYDVKYAGYLFCYSEDMEDWTDIPNPEMMEVIGNKFENPELLDNQ